jgi:hypothetical protein
MKPASPLINFLPGQTLDNIDDLLGILYHHGAFLDEGSGNIPQLP